MKEQDKYNTVTEISEVISDMNSDGLITEEFEFNSFADGQFLYTYERGTESYELAVISDDVLFATMLGSDLVNLKRITFLGITRWDTKVEYKTVFISEKIQKKIAEKDKAILN